MLAMRVCASQLLGFALQWAFSQGTGCVVELHRPWISFFPLRGSIRKINIYHPRQGPDAGFKSDKISVALDIRPLFSKLVQLQDLHLEGASASSIGTETGFINTLVFLFAHSDPPVKKESGWFSSFTQGWRVRVPRVIIETRKSPQPHFIIGDGPIAAQFNEVAFVSIDPKDDPTVPVEISATGTNLHLTLGSQPARYLGNVDFKVKIGGGVVDFEDVRIDAAGSPLNPERQSKAYFAGKLYTAGQGSYDAAYQGELYDSFLGALVNPLSAAYSTIEGRGLVKGKLSGPLLRPQLSGELNLQLTHAPNLFPRDECAPQVISAAFDFNADHLSLNQIRVEDLLQNGSLEAKFDGVFKAQGLAELHVRQDGQYYQRCAGAPGRGDSKTALGVQTKHLGQNAFFSLSYQLSPELIQGSLRKDRSGPVDLRASPATSAPSVDAAKLNLDLAYYPALQKLSLKKLEVVQYPAKTLLVLAAPMMDRTAFDYIFRIFQAQTLFNAKGEAEVNLRQNEQAGTLEASLSHLALDYFGESSLKTKISANAGQFLLQEMSLTSASGAIRAGAEADLKGQTRGSISFERYDLGALPGIAAWTPALSVFAGGQIKWEGKTDNPLYEGEIAVEAQSHGPRSKSYPSELKIKGDKEKLNLQASLFSGKGEIALEYPLFSSSVKTVTLAARAFELPLADFFSGTDAAGPGTLSGSLTYSGPKGRLLSGKGELRVSRLELPLAEGLQLSHVRPLYAAVDAGRLSFVDCAFLLGGKELVLSGYVDERSGWHAQAGGAIKLAAELDHQSLFEHVAGTASATLQLSGALMSPKLSGHISLDNGSLTLPLGKSGVSADQVQLQAVFDGDDLVLESLSANVGQGKLRGGGRVNRVLSAKERQAEFQVSLNGIDLEPADNLTLVLDSGLVLKGEQGVWHLGGDVIIKELLYEDKTSLPQLLKKVSTAVIGKGVEQVQAPREREARASESPLSLSLRVHADNGLIVDTDFAQAELRTDLRVSGTSADPRLEGTISVVEGSFGLKTNSFDITTGEAIFSERSTLMDPRLNITGETTLRSRGRADSHVRLVITGSLTDPRVVFNSDAGLSQQEILTLLGLGADISSLQPFGRRTQRVGFGELVNPGSDLTLRERFSWLTNFSQVGVETVQSTRTGEFVPAVVAKRPLIGKFDLSLQSELDSQQTSEVNVDYPLSPYLSLVSGWQSVPVTSNVDSSSGNYGIGLNYRKTFPGFIFSVNSPLKEEGGGKP